MSDVRPPLVDLVLTKCTPGVAAYEATILDLAARGFLGVSGGPEGLRVTLARLSPGGRSAARTARAATGSSAAPRSTTGRAWIFSEPHVYIMVAVGDLVQVTFSPRTGQLQRLTVTAARSRAEHGGAPG